MYFGRNARSLRTSKAGIALTWAQEDGIGHHKPESRAEDESCATIYFLSFDQKNTVEALRLPSELLLNSSCSPRIESQNPASRTPISPRMRRNTSGSTSVIRCLCCACSRKSAARDRQRGSPILRVCSERKLDRPHRRGCIGDSAPLETVNNPRAAAMIGAHCFRGIY